MDHRGEAGTVVTVVVRGPPLRGDTVMGDHTGRVAQVAQRTRAGEQAWQGPAAVGAGSIGFPPGSTGTATGLPASKDMMFSCSRYVSAKLGCTRSTS
mmetsp:Transcript_24927/g.45780  ORF Transcript_24927/g.45780 Transcript_24927/m.45780 type:complete len:97 (+) Transcript_24927:150-440(+)